MFGIRKLVLGLSDGKRSFMIIEGLQTVKYAQINVTGISYCSYTESCYKQTHVTQHKRIKQFNLTHVCLFDSVRKCISKPR